MGNRFACGHPGLGRDCHRCARCYRVLVDATTVKPLRFMSHETYNGLV